MPSPLPLKTEIPEIDLREALDLLPSGILISDSKGVILYCNQTQSQIDGLPREKIIGHHLTELYVPSPDCSPMMATIRTGQPIFNLFEIYETRAGRVINSIHTTLPLFKNGQSSGCICLITPLNHTQQSDEESLAVRKSILFDNLIGSSPAFRDSINAALSAADTPSSVLIYGETGSGKELLARQLHDHSQRMNRPYVAINCSAIPATLLEGMLFGVVKGAFTGAQSSPGLFEQANGGTIYLDELDSMPLDLQPKLLRALQERRVRRVGAASEKEIDVKIISSFSCDPLEAVKAGKVRADLFYRLGVVIIHIPPLRERLTDLPGLISFFMNKHTAILKKKVDGLSPEVMVIFKHHNWPGNVRELENVIEGALNMIGDGGLIEPVHLPHYFRHLIISSPVKNIIPPEELCKPTVLAASGPTQVPRPGRREIVTAMTEGRGSITEAARLLGVSRQCLSYRLKKYGLNREQFDL